MANKSYIPAHCKNTFQGNVPSGPLQTGSWYTPPVSQRQQHQVHNYGHYVSNTAYGHMSWTPQVNNGVQQYPRTSYDCRNKSQHPNYNSQSYSSNEMKYPSNNPLTNLQSFSNGYNFCQPVDTGRNENMNSSKSREYHAHYNRETQQTYKVSQQQQHTFASGHPINSFNNNNMANSMHHGKSVHVEDQKKPVSDPASTTNRNRNNLQHDVPAILKPHIPHSNTATGVLSSTYKAPKDIENEFQSELMNLFNCGKNVSLPYDSDDDLSLSVAVVGDQGKTQDPKVPPCTYIPRGNQNKHYHDFEERRLVIQKKERFILNGLQRTLAVEEMAKIKKTRNYIQGKHVQRLQNLKNFYVSEKSHLIKWFLNEKEKLMCRLNGNEDLQQQKTSLYFCLLYKCDTLLFNVSRDLTDLLREIIGQMKCCPMETVLQQNPTTPTDNRKFPDISPSTFHKLAPYMNDVGCYFSSIGQEDSVTNRNTDIPRIPSIKRKHPETDTGGMEISPNKLCRKCPQFSEAKSHNSAVSDASEQAHLEIIDQNMNTSEVGCPVPANNEITTEMTVEQVRLLLKEKVTSGEQMSRKALSELSEQSKESLSTIKRLYALELVDAEMPVM